MANTIKIRRSAVEGAVPTTGQLALGELAINTFDGKLYTKKDNGTASIVELSGGGGGSPGGSNTQIQFNDSGSFGGDADLTWNKTDNLLDISGNLQLKAQGDLRFADSDSSHYVALQAPATVSSNVTLTLPGADGTNGQVLTTNGSGTLSWAAAPAGSAGGSDTQIQFNDGGTISGDSALTWDKDNNILTLNNSDIVVRDNFGNKAIEIEAGADSGTIRFWDENNNYNIAISTPSPSLAANSTYFLPEAYPASNGYVLSSTTAGVMSWVAQSGGGSGDVVLASNNAFTGANTFTNSTGQTFRQAATQDGILLRGRAGGTNSRTVEIVPASLTASRTLTAPDVTGTIVTTGDTGTVATAMVADAAITYAKIQSVAASRLLGRTSASSGAPQEITVANGLAFDGTTLQGPTDTFVVACSDETTALTTGTNKVRFRMPFAATLLAVRASVNTAPTGSTLIVNIKESGSTVLGTKLSIDASETTSTTAASAATITDSSLADDAEIAIDIDQIGSTVAGAGLKVMLSVRRT